MRGGMARVIAVKRETNNGRDSDGAERPWCKERGKGREREREEKCIWYKKRGNMETTYEMFMAPNKSVVVLAPPIPTLCISSSSFV